MLSTLRCLANVIAIFVATAAAVSAAAAAVTATATVAHHHHCAPRCPAVAHHRLCRRAPPLTRCRLCRRAPSPQVNNAGLALGLESAPAASLDDWETMIDTNCKGLAFMTRALLPGFVARNRGHVINIGSTAGEFPYPGGNCYGATKAFVYQFSLNLRADLAGTAVRVTDVEPGMCGGTEFSNVRFKGDDAKAASVYAHTTSPVLTAEDVAESVAWVAGLPPHVNVNSLQLMPVCQTFAPFNIARAPPKA